MTSPTDTNPDELPILEGYAAWAPLYDDDGNPLTAIEEPVLGGWFGPLDGRDALDLGCGTGRHTMALARAGARVSALDCTPAMIELARAKLRGFAVDWCLHRLPAPLPFADRSFDLVVLGLVAEHVDRLDDVLREAHRVARPSARCLLSALHPDRTRDGQKARFIDPATGQQRHIRTIHRTTGEMLAAARDAGWSLVEQRPLIVPAELADRLPRALPYVGQALGWAACWEKPVGVG